MKNIGIIGCGASGIMAAITIKKNNKNHNVTILEANDKPGKKLLATGNGKCNFSNLNMDASYYNESAGEFIESVISSFSPDDAVAFFKSIGVQSVEKNGYLYPRSEQASSIVSALIKELKHLDVTVKLKCEVTKIFKSSDTNIFQAVTEEKTYSFDAIIIATGGNSGLKSNTASLGYGFATCLGHSVLPTVPALVQLVAQYNHLKPAKGVRVGAKASAIVNGNIKGSSIGELQITEYGISGILIFQISGIISRALDRNMSCSVRLDFVPDFTNKELAEAFKEQRNTLGHLLLSDVLNGYFPDKLSKVLIKTLGLPTNIIFKDIDDKQLIKLVAYIKSFDLRIKSTNGFDNSQVTSGGAALDEVSPETMSSLICEGLYLTGEVLDVDGHCGGYNLHFAWASGYLAGLSCAGI